MPITPLPKEATPRSKQDLLYSTLLALGGGGSGITRLPPTEVPRSEQDLLYSIMLAAQGLSAGGGLEVSSQAQAEEGLDNETVMTPLRVEQKLTFNLGAPTTIGKALLNLANPGAITFLRMNADNTASALSVSDMRTALGLGTMATQAASAVTITGGSVSGLTSFGLGSISPLFVVGDANTFYTGSGWGVGFRSTADTVARLWVAKGIGMSATATNAPDVFLQPQSANVLQLGVAGSSPSAQCFKGPNGVGANIVGGKLGICAGQSTGNATPGKLALQGTASGSSGSTAQTLVDVLTIANASYITLGDATVAAALTLGIAASGGLIIGQTNSTALGFWGASPVNQWNTEGTGGIASAGSGTPVLDDSKFTGGAGSLAYTINDIVAALKACGIMAS